MMLLAVLILYAIPLFDPLRRNHKNTRSTWTLCSRIAKRYWRIFLRFSFFLFFCFIEIWYQFTVQILSFPVIGYVCPNERLEMYKVFINGIFKPINIFNSSTKITWLFYFVVPWFEVSYKRGFSCFPNIF